LWQDNSTNERITVNIPGSYSVKVQGFNGCFASDTIKVNNSNLSSFTLGNDTTLCDNHTLKYHFNLPAANYLWNTGATTSRYDITSAGIYWLEVTQGSCTKRDTIKVSFVAPPSVNLGNDTTLCQGVTQLLDAYYPDASYLWNNGATTATNSVVNQGRYWVSVKGKGCTVSDTINIEYLIIPSFPLGSDTTLCEGQSITLEPAVTNASIKWHDGTAGAIYKVTQPGLYKVTITNQCTTVQDEINVGKGVCQLLMPNAFTPNNDGHNDVFRVRYPQFIKKFHLQIFDRWGQTVYRTSDPSRGWDGKLNGMYQPVGNYVWTISLTDINGKISHFKGSVLLLQ
jgi:gliding motility-associated-like protein